MLTLVTVCWYGGSILAFPMKQFSPADSHLYSHLLPFFFLFKGSQAATWLIPCSRGSHIFSCLLVLPLPSPSCKSSPPPATFPPPAVLHIFSLFFSCPGDHEQRPGRDPVCRHALLPGPWRLPEALQAHRQRCVEWMYGAQAGCVPCKHQGGWGSWGEAGGVLLAPHATPSRSSSSAQAACYEIFKSSESAKAAVRCIAVELEHFLGLGSFRFRCVCQPPKLDLDLERSWSSAALSWACVRCFSASAKSLLLLMSLAHPTVHLALPSSGTQVKLSSQVCVTVRVTLGYCGALC